MEKLVAKSVEKSVEKSVAKSVEQKISSTLTKAVFVYLCICTSDTGEHCFKVLVPSPFQKYSTCCAYVQL